MEKEKRKEERERIAFENCKCLFLSALGRIIVAFCQFITDIRCRMPAKERIDEFLTKSQGDVLRFSKCSREHNFELLMTTVHIPF